MNEPKYIGIDSAATTGWAFIASSRSGTTHHWECGVIRADSPQKYDVLEFAKEHGVTHACIEKPAPFTGSHAHVATSMNISYGRWEEACCRCGLIVVPCFVSQWQAAMLVLNGVRLRQNDKKEASTLIAKTLGACPRNGDEADAVCLAAYGPAALAKAAEKVEEKRVAKNAKARARRKS